MELKAIQLTKQYGSKTAVNHLNLSLSNGVYGLLGANGAGKTTLMRLDGEKKHDKVGGMVDLHHTDII